MPIGPASQTGGLLLTDPENRLCLAGAPGQEQGEGRGARCVTGNSINFMQRRSDEAAAQPLIQSVRAKCDALGMDSAIGFQPASHQRLGQHNVHDLFYHISGREGQYRDSWKFS